MQVNNEFKKVIKMLNSTCIWQCKYSYSLDSLQPVAKLTELWFNFLVCKYDKCIMHKIIYRTYIYCVFVCILYVVFEFFMCPPINQS